jgi:peptidoglycan/xylan/chitin deacetylase (PgdA/CDA1 family)
MLSVLKRTPPSERDRAVVDIERVLGRPPLSPTDQERYEFLTWADVRRMSQAGVEFGSHTVTHSIVSTLDDDALKSELIESKRTIEQHTGQECYSFAYPNGGTGDFGPRDKMAIQGAGYRCALALLGGLVGSSPDLFALQRVNVGRQYEVPMLDAATTGVLMVGQRARTLLHEHARRKKPSTPPINCQSPQI